MSVTPQTNCTLSDIADALRERDHIVICGHTNPDGDCLGSQLALAGMLRALGKEVTCVYAQGRGCPAGLEHLPGIEGMVCAAEFAGTCETFISVDVQVQKRIADAMPIAQSAQYRISIDHHAVDGCYADLNYVDPDAAATCLLIWELAAHLCSERTAELATCCYTGLMTDTGGFRFSNSDAACFAAAGEMVAAGADPACIATHVYQSRRVESLRLEAIMLERIEMHEEQGLIMSTLRAEDFEKAGACHDDSDTFVDILRTCAPVRIVCLLREHEGSVRGSLRAKDLTDVSAVARDFGGGGHMVAAGFTIEDATIDSCIECVRARLLEQLRSA